LHHPQRSSTLANTNLAAYLNDHLAASVGALDLLRFLRSQALDEAMAATLEEVLHTIESERDELIALMGRLGIAQWRPRQLATWIGVRATRLHLRFGGEAARKLHLLQAIELVAIGIEGKSALWRVLRDAGAELPVLREVDFSDLLARSASEREVMERLRLQAARSAFTHQ
jgi:hypothetical protein